MIDITLGGRSWRVELLEPECDTIILEARESFMPEEYALHIMRQQAGDSSAQTAPDRPLNEVEVSAVARHATPEQHAQGELGHIDPRSVVMTPIEFDIPEALRLVQALLRHIPPIGLPSPLRIEDVRSWADQIEAAVGDE